MVLVEKRDQIRSRDREIGTIIIPEPRSNSRVQCNHRGPFSCCAEAPGERITKRHNWHHMGGQETNVLAAKRSLGAER